MKLRGTGESLEEQGPRACTVAHGAPGMVCISDWYPISSTLLKPQESEPLQTQPQ